MTEPLKTLTREQIFTPRPFPKELVPVPEWGGSVYVRAMTAKERDKYQMAQIDFSEKKPEIKGDNQTASLCSMTICDENYKLIFSDPEDVKLLGKQPAGVLEPIAKVARRLSGLTDDEVEKHEKNSEKTTTDDS